MAELKAFAEKVGPFNLLYDHTAGSVSMCEAVDLVDVVPAEQALLSSRHDAPRRSANVALG